MSLLSEHELSHPSVIKIKELLEQRLNKYRIKNDQFNADQSTRGRIAEIKSLQKIIYTLGV